MRNVELDIMKFYGILLVVIGHIALIYTPMTLIVPKLPSDFMSTLKDVIYSFHMPMFFFISGAVFAYQVEIKKKQMTFKALVINKAKRLMIPFFIFGFCLMWPTLVLLGYRDPFHYAIDGFIYSIDPRHLWFVEALFGVFLLFYGLKWICGRFKLPLWTILIVAIVSYFYQVDYIYFQVKNTLHYLLWFTLGYIFLLYRANIKPRAIFLLTILTLLGGWMLNHFGGETIKPLSKMVWALCGISVCYLIAIRFPHIANTRLYKWVLPNSFGLYLFHEAFIYLMEHAAKDYPFHPILLSAVVFIVSTTVSILLTVAVRRYLSPAIIGENRH